MMLIKKRNSFFVTIVLFCSYASFMYTKAPDTHFSHYMDPSQSQHLSNQFFSTFNCGVSSHQDSYYRYQMYIRAELSKCWILNCNKQYFLIQLDDVYLIEKICADNQHTSLDALRASNRKNNLKSKQKSEIKSTSKKSKAIKK